MSYSNFDRKERRKKTRRRQRYETQKMGQEEIAMIEAEDKKNGVDDSNTSNGRTGNSD